MTIDARIPLMGQFRSFDLAASLEAGMRLRALQEQMDAAREDRKRDAERRSKLSDFILAGGGQAPASPAGQVAPLQQVGTPIAGRPDQQSPPSRLANMMGMAKGGLQPDAASVPAMPTPQGPNIGEMRRSAWEALVRVDPDGALKIRKSQFDNMKDEVELVGTLAMGAKDQASYEDALRRASGYGLDVSQLPREYNPELIEGYRYQAAGAAQALMSIARDKRLQWDMEDDLADNERADRNLESQIGYRQERLEDFDEAEEGRDRRFQAAERGRAQRSQKPRTAPRSSAPSPTSVIGRIMDKQASGQPLTPAEQRTYDEYRAGKGGRGGGGGRSRDGAVIVNPKTGQRMVLQGGKWVPVK